MEQQYEQEQEQPRAVAYQSPMRDAGSNMILLTNPEDGLYKMELTFRSKIADRDGNTKSVGEPLMNELGISSVIGQVQTIVNQTTIMSNLNEKEIPSLIDFLGDVLARDLMMNRVTYEINCSAARDKIYFAALSSAFICMKRAYQEGDKRFWKGSSQEITTRVDGNQKKSMFGTVMGWGKG